MSTPPSSRLLLEIPVPFRMADGELQVEIQAFNGICRWRDNFDHVTVCAVVDHSAADPALVYRSARALAETPGIVLQVLPDGYSPGAHFRLKKQVAELFRGLIGTHNYLCFSNLGWWGAWGSVAADTAYRLNRPYSVWLDWVLHEMPVVPTGNPVRDLIRAFRAWGAKQISLRSVRRSSLGLFHGRTVYDAYAPLCSHPQVVHDIHLKKSDIIAQEVLEARLLRESTPLRVGYVGRVHPMKGPFQWVEAVEKSLNLLGGSGTLEALWLGTGPLLEESRKLVETKGLGSSLQFLGQVDDRAAVVDTLRSLDVFVFCHLTPESPRCLIEALMAGVPIVGYESTYAADLVAEHGGGRFVPVGDVDGLASLLVELTDRTRLRDLSREAFASGSAFSDEEVFRHRSDLIKQYLQ